MESIIETTSTVTLKLTREEALWLKTLVQNPLRSNENDFESKIRRNFWDALSGVTYF